LNAIPCDHKAAPFDKFVQGRLSIDIEMPMELFVNGLHVTRAVEGRVEVLAEAHRVMIVQILPAEAALTSICGSSHGDPHTGTMSRKNIGIICFAKAASARKKRGGHLFSNKKKEEQIPFGGSVVLFEKSFII
jgi:hypothetical protein